MAAPAKPPANDRLLLLSIGLNSLAKIGAGDGIRTHDPNLGKVVLYP